MYVRMYSTYAHTYYIYLCIHTYVLLYHNNYICICIFLTEGHKDKLFLERMLYKAKKQGLTIKVRHGKVLFCGPSGAGKSSFSYLLRNKEHKSKYISTPVAGMVNVLGTDWKDLDSRLEIQQLRERFMHKLTQQPDPHNSVDNPQQIKPKKAESVAFTKTSKSDTSPDSYSNPIAGDTEHKLVLAEKAITSDTDISSPQAPTSSESTKSNSDVWDVLTLLDAGGQPEFINLLPTMNALTSIAFVIFNMSDGVDCLDKPVIAQHSDESYEGYTLNYSVSKMLKCLLSSIEDSSMKEIFYPKQLNIVQKDCNSKTVVYFVGTHADVIKDKLKTVVSAINKRIGELVEDIDDKKISIQSIHCVANKYLHTVDNTVPRDRQGESLQFAQSMREESKKILDKQPVFEIPVTWFLLELELRLLYETKKKVYVLLSEVKQIYDRIAIGNQEMELWQIEEVLKFFHFFGVLLYFHEVCDMKDYVITNPEWLFQNLNKIVECKFKKEGHDVKTINKVNNEGIFNKALLAKIDLDIKDFKMEPFLNLLLDLRIFAQINDSEYFMPSILPLCDENIDEQQFFNEMDYGKPGFYKDNGSFIEVKPLLIEFESGLIPRGLFGLLVVQLLQNNKDFKLCGKNTNNELCRFSNLITLFQEPCYYITLQDKISFLELQIRVSDDEPSIHCAVQKAVTEALQVVFEKFHWKFINLRYGFFCERKSTKSHLTRLSNNEPFPHDNFPKYSSCKKQHGGTKLTEVHKIWFLKVRYYVHTYIRSSYVIFIAYLL